MRRDSTLSDEVRVAAVHLFAVGYGGMAAATHLGVGVAPITRLYNRWRVRGEDALVHGSTQRRYSFEEKLEVVRRFNAGEHKTELAAAFGLSSPKTVESWARAYRTHGEDGLRPKQRGRPSTVPRTREEALEQENLFLRTKVALLEKLQTLDATE
ncbi:MAG: helix-turn-helix domain-containing protein [Thermomicrobiales bacterium]|nr:helix-turn-helix domain-containing protein [Thermomicrobiales bacterium]MCO5219198.1 helix-turn-helix domain-containing protein [Thermomicrobiales bacterium]MCO5225083.1 helix-turn-helix domain-containing protein [Thermomicrobiales bacterium]MCO5228135.1 helix-turn-helix domain-containing protein [Thermomicrobiales bacterium]